MKIYRIEMGVRFRRRFIPVAYAPTKAEAIKKAKAVYKGATYLTGWRIQLCALPDRLSVSDWAEVLASDLLAAEDTDRTVSDFVVPIEVVHEVPAGPEEEALKKEND